MTFTYYWKTPDNVRHGGEIEANDREEAFAKLRGRGIRAIKVEPKGWETGKGYRGVRRRAVVGIILAAALSVAAAWWWAARTARGPYRVMTPQGPVMYTVAAPLPRQQIPGDRARLMHAPTNLFAFAAETVLARYAEPGRIHAAERNANGAQVDEEEWRRCLAEPVRIAGNDFTEWVDLKRIVVGMKREMAAYLAAGGTVDDYLSELAKRQKLEASYRERAERRLRELLSGGDAEAAYAYWLKANAQLKSMGIWELPLPESLNSYQMSLEI